MCLRDGWNNWSRRRDSLPDADSDDDLRNILRTGDDGKHRLVELAARMVARGMNADDVIAALEELYDTCEWKDQKPARWRKRRAEVREHVASG